MAVRSVDMANAVLNWHVLIWSGLSVELQAYINRQIREEDRHYWNKAVFSGVQLF